MRPLDPHPDEQRRRAYTQDEWKAVLAGRDLDLVERRARRLHHVMNRLVWASVQSAPPGTYDTWDGTLGIDGTSARAAWRGTSTKASHVSSEPDAGWYRRDGDHNGGDGKKALFWGWEANLVALTSPHADDTFPKTIIGVSIGKPGVRPRHQAWLALENVVEHDLPRGFMVGDKLYAPMSDPKDWQIPIRKLGYRIIADQIKGQTGRQAAHEGAILVDGNWACPAMPQLLQTAATDFDAGTIDPDTYTARMCRRAVYLLREKEAPLRNGAVRLKCPRLAHNALGWRGCYSYSRPTRIQEVGNEEHRPLVAYCRYNNRTIQFLAACGIGCFGCLATVKIPVDCGGNRPPNSGLCCCSPAYLQKQLT